MQKYIKKFCIYLLIFGILLIFSGCDINKEEKKTIDDKIAEEISFIEDEILTLINRYAKKEYIEGEELNWDNIASDCNKINNSVDTIVLDLSEGNLSNDEIVKFSNEVNNLNVFIANKDESGFIQSCSTLYTILSDNFEKISDNKNKVNFMKLKAIVISSFVQSNLTNWDEAKNNINLAESKYKEMMDDIDYMQEYSYNLNKVYILIEELKTVIDSEEKDLARIKYINFIEKV